MAIKKKRKSKRTFRTQQGTGCAPTPVQQRILAGNMMYLSHSSSCESNVVCLGDGGTRKVAFNY